MENKNQVLSIPQMQELIDLGIDTSKASMMWFDAGESGLVIGWKNCSFEPSEGDIPTFTLQDILEMLPKTIEAYKDGSKLPLIITITGSGKYAIVYDNPFCKNGKVGLTISESLLEAAFNMLKWCKKNGYI